MATFASKKSDLLTYKKIAEILETGDFDKFIDCRESEILEAKSKNPYDLSQKKSILELSKDVASLANNKGGYIVCGLITEKPADSPHDYIKSHEIFLENIFYAESKIRGVISSNIYPKINLTVKWYPSKGDANNGLGVIEVFRQDENNKYFVIKVLDTEGNSPGEYFGIPVRTDDATKWLKTKDFHKLSKRKPTNLLEFYTGLSTQIEELKSMSILTASSTINIDSIPAKIEETIYGNEK